MTRSILFFLLLALLYLPGLLAQSLPADSARTALLFQTIRQGDAVALQSQLHAGASANSRLNGYSALMAAALNGTAEEMKILIDNGADVNYFNKDSISAIWLAVPDAEKTKLLISKGANVQQISREGNNVLVKLAAIPGSAALIQLLIDNGCNPLKSGVANDIMYNAAGSGDTAIVGLLIRHGVSVNDTAAFGDYPVNGATPFRSLATMKMLVENGADVNVAPKHALLPLFVGITPLMWAAVSNDKPTFDYLLAHGANVKAKSPGGYTTLMFAAMANEDDPEMTTALIKAGVSPTEKALDETDALHHAKLKGNTKSVAILSKYVSTK